MSRPADQSEMAWGCTWSGEAVHSSYAVLALWVKCMSWHLWSLRRSTAWCRTWARIPPHPRFCARASSRRPCLPRLRTASRPPPLGWCPRSGLNKEGRRISWAELLGAFKYFWKAAKTLQLCVRPKNMHAMFSLLSLKRTKYVVIAAMIKLILFHFSGP